MSIPALDRGLIILDALVSSNSPLKYTDLKKTIKGISDSSLNRLISSLMDSDYIKKDSDGRYIKSGRLLRWGDLLANQQSLTLKIQTMVENTVHKSKESAAFATLRGNRIEISKSISKENSISIISEAQILHFKEDHAGALAIIYQLSKEERKNCLSSEYSKINNNKTLNEGLRRFSQEKEGFTYYLDESREREGVSRLAIPLKIKNDPCSLFICAPTIRIKNHLSEFLAILQREAASIL